MSHLQDHLIGRIRDGGPLPFSAFMRECLYHRLWGYYGSGKARIGACGDFYTAVSVGPLLGKLLARQFIQMWELLGCPRAWCLTEQGAFDGSLARDILCQIESASPDCFAATELWIIEPFDAQKKKQQTLLHAFLPKIRWFSSLESCPSFEGVHYSNELLDAFPVDVVRRRGESWTELRVAVSSDRFEWTESPVLEPYLMGETAFLSNVPEGFLREICAAYGKWAEVLSGKLKRGWILALDYGLTESELALPHRSEGTVTGYKNHQHARSLLEDPGNQDITHQVNFSALCREANRAGLEVISYSSQAQFLTPLGIAHFEQSQNRNSGDRSREVRAFGTLTHPDAMGHRFKALILSTPCCTRHSLEGARYGIRGEL